MLSKVHCMECLNYWMIRDGRNCQVNNVTCKYNIGYKLFSPNLKKDSTIKCKEGSGDGSGDDYDNGSNDGGSGDAYIYYCNVLLICTFVIMNLLLN